MGIIGRNICTGSDYLFIELIGIYNKMGTMIILGMEPGVVVFGIFKGKIIVLNIVLAESYSITIITI